MGVSSILITSDSPAFVDNALSVLDHQSREDLLELGKTGLFIALELIQELGGSISTTQCGEQAAIAITITTSDK